VKNEPWSSKKKIKQSSPSAVISTNSHGSFSVGNIDFLATTPFFSSGFLPF
jgi:hypothetical protein